MLHQFRIKGKGPDLTKYRQKIRVDHKPSKSHPQSFWVPLIHLAWRTKLTYDLPGFSAEARKACSKDFFMADLKFSLVERTEPVRFLNATPPGV